MNLAIIVDKRMFPFNWKIKRVFNKSPLVDKVISVNSKSEIDKNLKKYNLKYEDTVTFHIASKSLFTIHRKIREAINDLNDLIRAAIEHGSAILGLKVPATIKLADNKGIVLETPDRKKFYEVQYPQSVVYGLFERYRNRNDSLYRIDLLGLDTKVIDINMKW